MIELDRYLLAALEPFAVLGAVDEDLAIRPVVRLEPDVAGPVAGAAAGVAAFPFGGKSRNVTVS